jgi:recombination protein RecA
MGAMASALAAPSLRAIMARVNKEHGAGTILLGSELNFEHMPRITSGALSLDVSLGGGWPANQWHEIYGEFSSGKTALVLQTIAANQRIDPEWRVWWLAAESFEPAYARLNGVDLSRVHVHNTNVMEDGFQQILEVAITREIDCVVIDSLPALIPLREDENDAGALAPGLSALLTNQFFRKEKRATGRSLIEADRPITGFVINQFREKIGVMHGDPRTTPGGKGKDFAYFTRVELRRDDWIKDGPEPVGITIKATIRKNKSHRPMRTATFDYYMADSGNHQAGAYDLLGQIVDVGIAYKVIVAGGGGMYYYQGEGFKGRDALKEAIAAQDHLRKGISEDVIRVAVYGEDLNIVEVFAEEAAPAKKAVVKKAAPRKRALDHV